MKVSITARHFDLTEELKSFINDEIDKLERFFDNIVSSNVVLEVQGHRQLAEVTLKVSRATLTGTSESDDMYVSVEGCIDKLKAQLKKHKGKLKDRQQKKVSDDKTTLPELTSEEDVSLDY